MNASSWTTKQPGGFTEEQLAALRRVVTPLARVIEIISLTRTAASLLDTYVATAPANASSAVRSGAATPRP